MTYESYLIGDRSNGLSSIPDQMHLFGEPEYFKFGITFWNAECTWIHSVGLLIFKPDLYDCSAVDVLVEPRPLYCPAYAP